MAREYLYQRHRLPIRVMHWVNALALALLLMSGLQIFNAHPRLYWGKSSYTGAAPILDLRAAPIADGQPPRISILGYPFEKNRTARPVPRLVRVSGLGNDSGPKWLAMGRRWHFFFAWVFVINGALYLAYSFASRHVSRDLDADANATGARSAVQSWITCAFVIRRARPPSTTTCFRSWPTLR